MKTSTGLWKKKRGGKKPNTHTIVMYVTGYISNNTVVFCFIIPYLLNKKK